MSAFDVGVEAPTRSEDRPLQWRRAEARCALLRFGGQSILCFLTEDWDANRCGREVVRRGNRRHNFSLRFFLSFFFYCGEYAATRPEGRRYVRPKALFRNALAVHRAVPRRPRCGGLGRAAPNLSWVRTSRYFLHGGRQWRRLEDDRFWKHVESDFRRSAHWLRRRAGRCSVRSEHHLCWQRRRFTTPGFGHRRWGLQIHGRGKNLDARWFRKRGSGNRGSARRATNHRDSRRFEESQSCFRRRRRASLWT